MTRFEVGDVVSVEFPFSDLQASKRRPGLVLLAGEGDVVVARVTTHAPRGPSDIGLTRWREVGLPRPSTIRLTKFATIDHRLIHHRIGRLHQEDKQAVASTWDSVANEIRLGLQR